MTSVRSTERWLLEYPDLDLYRHRQLLTSVSLEELLHLAFDAMNDHEDDIIWQFIRELYIEKQLTIHPQRFYDLLIPALTELNQYIMALLEQIDEGTCMDFLEDHALYSTITDPRARTILVTFQRVY